MNHRSTDKLRVLRYQAAAEWYIRLHEEDVSDAALAEWLGWCEDPENLKEFQTMGRIWRAAANIDPAGEIESAGP